MAVSWGYFDQYEGIIDRYMPWRGEGETLASQTATAINKLIYKWYNDGDVFDNTHGMDGWVNDLSDYANWLDTYVEKSREVLSKIMSCNSNSRYEDILKELADTVLIPSYLEEINNKPKEGSIYRCKGRFKFKEYDYYEYEDYEEEWD